ncbi:hypothetical protein, partial [Escherichia coli]|uniref:hypothetical protein n=1 Tax=Escherichia coli TaxID=562 RepID=UPI0032E50C70
MPFPKSLATSFLGLSAAAVLACATAGGAAAAPDTVTDQKDPVVASLAVKGAGVADYWTADRMRNAVPGEVLAGNALERASRPGAPAAAKVKPEK